uniref:Uncharacterized protein n=1 Tax=Arundo donax TaxID=35708 RepID=A0A0A9DKU4_ARUDO
MFLKSCYSVKLLITSSFNLLYCAPFGLWSYGLHQIFCVLAINISILKVFVLGRGYSLQVPDCIG